MKKIFVLYTGGTIGMVQGEHGLRPDAGIVETALKPFSGSLAFDWHVCQPLIDSSAITPHDWANWLDLLQHKLPFYDGVLMLHGTDTLAYTANILALCLNTQGKPIILTGSQKPFSHPQSDAPANLQTAISALQNESIQQVMLAFHGKLLPAIGSSKSSTEIDDGFSNTHFGFRQPETCDIHFSGSLKKFANEKRQFSPDVYIANLFLTPAQSLANTAKSWANMEFDALIMQTYGHGNSPSDETFLSWIQSLIVQGKRVLNISQVPQGCAAAVYAQGSALRQAGVINAGKCNVETATALMMLACANDWTMAQIENELRFWQLID